ncbi:NAD(P)/FAD-dependent oxidoreductase [Methanoregula sp.]|uniref:NAD(P)/FAD-dependent oxidoreductase n=1 Tax=Methanoregula sp. TaxID=2052170 RepID=UPI003563BB48
MGESDIVVAGAGPAGLFCAIQAAAAGLRVLVLEKNPQPGAKLLLAGSGQCNITHNGEIREFINHYGDHGKFLKPALLSFTNRDLIAFFQERGLSVMTEENGKIFPASRSSPEVLEVLLAECRKQGVVIRCGEPVTGIARTGNAFTVTTGSGTYHTATVVITTGGASYPKCGTTGDGYRFAAALGQPVTETGPALTPLLIRPFPFAALAGISFEKMHFTVWRENKKTGDHTGDVLFTHLGLSGPGILDASRNIRPGDVIRLSFVSPMRREEFSADLAQRAAENTSWQVSTILAKYPIPERLNRKLLKISGIGEDLKCAHFSAGLRSALVTNCTEFSLTVAALGEYSVAMVTRGGVALDGVNGKTMESKIVPGLFFAGEVLDIDGDTGGYNLQAAFSTGYLAGTAIRKRWEETNIPPEN